MANLSALMVARDQKLDFEERTRAVIYISEQTYSLIVKGLRILGFHDKKISRIQSDQQFRLDTAALQARIQEDRRLGKNLFWSRKVVVPRTLAASSLWSSWPQLRRKRTYGSTWMEPMEPQHHCPRVESFDKGCGALP